MIQGNFFQSTQDFYFKQLTYFSFNTSLRYGEWSTDRRTDNRNPSDIIMVQNSSSLLIERLINRLCAAISMYSVIFFRTFVSRWKESRVTCLVGWHVSIWFKSCHREHKLKLFYLLEISLESILHRSSTAGLQNRSIDLQDRFVKQHLDPSNLVRWM